MLSKLTVASLFFAATAFAAVPTAYAAEANAQPDVFSIEYDFSTRNDSSAQRDFERKLQRAARSYCSVGAAPGLNQAIRRCERSIVREVQSQIADRIKRSEADSRTS